jgi:hypothetical protein
MKGIANMDERKASMRLEDILTMRTGDDRIHEETKCQRKIGPSGFI